MANPMLARWYTLYTRQTASELALEPAIAALGRPYRFNHPIVAKGKWYFADFVLLDERVVIEVDGDSHKGKAAKKADAERTANLATKGWRVVRCTNEEALDDPTGTVKRLMKKAGVGPKVK